MSTRSAETRAALVERLEQGDTEDVLALADVILADLDAAEEQAAHWRREHDLAALSLSRTQERADRTVRTVESVAADLRAQAARFASPGGWAVRDTLESAARNIALAVIR